MPIDHPHGGTEPPFNIMHPTGNPMLLEAAKGFSNRFGRDDLSEKATALTEALENGVTVTAVRTDDDNQGPNIDIEIHYKGFMYAKGPSTANELLQCIGYFMAYVDQDDRPLMRAAERFLETEKAVQALSDDYGVSSGSLHIVFLGAHVANQAPDTVEGVATVLRDYMQGWITKPQTANAA